MSSNNDQQNSSVTRNKTLTASIFGGGAILCLAVLAHHPTASGVADTQMLSTISHLAASDRIVHGVLIAIVTAFWVAMSNLASHVGSTRVTVRSGLQLYGMGSFAMILAMLFDGFVIPEFATNAGSSDAIFVGILKFCSAIIQVLTKFGLVATVAGIAIYSQNLLKGKGLVRVTGIIGLLGGTITIVAVAIIGMHLNPYNLGLIFGMQAAWYLAIAIMITMNSLPTPCVSPQP